MDLPKPGTKRPHDVGKSGAGRRIALTALLLFCCVLMTGAVGAEDVGVTTWDELTNNFIGDKTVRLQNNISATGSFELTSGAVTLDLNGFTLSNTSIMDKGTSIFTINGNGASLTILDSGTAGKIESKRGVIIVRNGTLNVQGGTLRGFLMGKGGGEAYKTQGSAIGIYGSSSDSAVGHSVVTIGKNAVVEGYCYALNVLNKDNKAYGVEVTISGTLKGIQEFSNQDNAYSSCALAINGNVNQITGTVPKITINNGATLTGYHGKNSKVGDAAGPAIYAAGYGNWFIDGGTISGDEALSIKSGNWTINGGTFNGNGEFFDPAESYGDGSEPTGAVVSITTNHIYAKNVSMTITGGTFTSKKQSAFYEGENTKNTGTALKMVAISGGTFTTENTTLSAITIQTSGNSTIAGGISIMDGSNNLLYRGVNLTGAGATSTPNVKWTGDATSGYTLAIGKGGSYKLMDDFTTTKTGVKITADDVTFDGNGKKVTSLNDITGESVVIPTANNTKVQSLKVDDSGRTEASAAMSVFFVGSNSKEYKNITLSNNEIWSGTSTAHRNAGIVVGANDVTLDGNTIHLGTSGQTDTSTKQRNESIGIRVWTYKADTANLKIVNNTILKNASATNPQVGIHFDPVKTQSKVIIQNNAFDLGNTGFVLETMAEDQTAPSLELNFTDNTISSAASWLYIARDKVSDEAKYDYDLMLKGDIYNNNFSAVAGTFFSNATKVTVNTTDSDLTWNTTPTEIGTYKKIAPGQTNLAGNWWGTWSEGKKSTTGYLTFTDAAAAKAAGVPVADLAPLVTIGQPAAKPITITGVPGTYNLSAMTGSATGTMTATQDGVDITGVATWVSGNASIVTVTNGTYTVQNTAGSAVVSVTHNGQTATALFNVVAPVVANAPVKEPTDAGNGRTKVEVASGGTLTFIGNVATITSTDSSTANLTITYSKVTEHTSTVVTGKVDAVTAEYKPITALPPAGDNAPTSASIQMVLTTTSIETGLPVISPAVNATKHDFVTAKYPNVVLGVMADVTTTIKSGNITAVTLTFTVPEEWITANGGPSKIRAYHITDDGTVTPMQFNGRVDGANRIVLVKGTGFSAYGVGVDTTPTPVPTVTPVSGSSSGGGNTDGALRVLFVTDGGSSGTVVTGLSAGDKVSQPATPVRNGYTFGGWYTDAACTKAWSFSSSINGDMTLYAKWTSNGSGTVETYPATANPTQPATATQTSSPSGGANPTGTTAATTAQSGGVSPTM